MQFHKEYTRKCSKLASRREREEASTSTNLPRSKLRSSEFGFCFVRGNCQGQSCLNEASDLNNVDIWDSIKDDIRLPSERAEYEEYYDEA